MQSKNIPIFIDIVRANIRYTSHEFFSQTERKKKNESENASYISFLIKGDWWDRVIQYEVQVLRSGNTCFETSPGRRMFWSLPKLIFSFGVIFSAFSHQEMRLFQDACLRSLRSCWFLYLNK
jgi:hypothetical protein